jgi:hypothetical protein
MLKLLSNQMERSTLSSYKDMNMTMNRRLLSMKLGLHLLMNDLHISHEKDTHHNTPQPLIYKANYSNSPNPSGPPSYMRFSKHHGKQRH